MKKFASVLFFTIATCLCVSAQQSADLILFTEAGENFTVFFNGVQQNDTPKPRVKVEGITSSVGQVKVVFEDPGAPELIKTLMVRSGNEMTSVIKRNKKGKYKFGMISMTPLATTNDEVVLVQQSYTNQAVQEGGPTTDVSGPISASVEGKRIVLEDGRTFSWKYVDLNWAGVKVEMLEPVGAQAAISYDGKEAYSSEVPFIFDERDWQKNNAYFKLEVNEGNKSWAVKLKHSNGYKIVIDKSAGSSGSSSAKSNARSVSTGCTQSISASDFEAAKGSINNQAFADSKLSVAKQVVKNNCFTVDQVKELMGLFSYEEQKIDFAKMAYPKTINKQNYYQLNDAFTYSSSVDELNTFLEAQ